MPGFTRFMTKSTVYTQRSSSRIKYLERRGGDVF